MQILTQIWPAIPWEGKILFWDSRIHSPQEKPPEYPGVTTAVTPRKDLGLVVSEFFKDSLLGSGKQFVAVVLFDAPRGDLLVGLYKEKIYAMYLPLGATGGASIPKGFDLRLLSEKKWVTTKRLYETLLGIVPQIYHKWMVNSPLPLICRCTAVNREKEIVEEVSGELFVVVQETVCVVVKPRLRVIVLNLCNQSVDMALLGIRGGGLIATILADKLKRYPTERVAIQTDWQGRGIIFAKGSERLHLFIPCRGVIAKWVLQGHLEMSESFIPELLDRLNIPVFHRGVIKENLVILLHKLSHEVSEALIEVFWQVSHREMMTIKVRGIWGRDPCVVKSTQIPYNVVQSHAVSPGFGLVDLQTTIQKITLGPEKCDWGVGIQERIERMALELVEKCGKSIQAKNILQQMETQLRELYKFTDHVQVFVVKLVLNFRLCGGRQVCLLIQGQSFSHSGKDTFTIQIGLT